RLSILKAPIFQLTHLHYIHLIKKYRFRTLVFIGSIRMQTVSTSAGRVIVESDLQVVVSQDPIEGGPRLFHPAAFSRSTISLQASRYHGTSFDRLLIEARLFRFPRIEAM